MKQDTNQPLQVYTKIQQAQPAHHSTLPNKQVGYFVHVETDKIYKIKNCIDSEKTNAELYKRFSKDFIANIRKCNDQMVLCCGLEEGARIETSIGCKKNPGMFLITGIGILDQKYQQDFTKFDVEVSFMEYNDGNFYDLLCYTKVPLQMVKQDDHLCFGESYCKISTFGQFLKLFKIALFNNKERDFKTESLVDLGPGQKVKTSLIMTIITKKYQSYAKNANTQIQKNVIIDFAGSRPSTFQQENASQKNVWDYFLIQLNNRTSRRKIHYHLVQQNPLLQLTKSFFQSGKTYLLPSFTANPNNFPDNHRYFTQLYQLAELVLKQNDNIISQSPSMNATLKRWELLSLQREPHQGELLAVLLDGVDGLLVNIKGKKYTSLRQYREVKEKSMAVISRLMGWIQNYRKLINKLMANKRLLKLTENQMIADQIKLIGVCVKSQNYKDFYSAKSYISLQRELDIKTQGWRQQLTSLTKQKYQIRDKFAQLRSKHQQFINSDLTEMPQLKPMTHKILDFCNTIFHNIILYTQRTIADEVLKQENINQNLNTIYKKLMYLDGEICNMGKNGNIQFEVNQFRKDAHLAFLVKEVENILKKSDKTRSRKLIGGEKSGKTKVMNGKQNENQNRQTYEGTGSTKFTKLPSLLMDKKTQIIISGNVNFSSLLLLPEQSNK